jgi:hypothetical protein
MELQALHTALATTIILIWFAILVGWLATCRVDEGITSDRQGECFLDDRQPSGVTSRPLCPNWSLPRHERWNSITMTHRTIQPKAAGMRGRQDGTTLTR